MSFLLVGNSIVNADHIQFVDIGAIEHLELHVFLVGNEDPIKVTGIQAIEVLMTLKPSALENRRLKWARNIWALHNLVGHPLMQVLAFFRQYKWAMWVHDVTVPRPLGRKK